MDKMILLNEKRINERERLKKLAAKKEWLSSSGSKGEKGTEVAGEKAVDGDKGVAESGTEIDAGKGGKKRKNRGTGQIESNEATVTLPDESKLFYLLPYYTRLLSFAMPQNHQKKVIIVNTDPSQADLEEPEKPLTTSKQNIIQELSQAVFSKFGLTTCLEKLDISVDKDVHEEFSSKKLKLEAELQREKKSGEKVKSSDKNLTKKEKRKEKNQENKMKKKKMSTLQEQKKNILNLETRNEMQFKKIIAENIQADGLINFKNIFCEKKFVKSEVDIDSIDSVSIGDDVTAIASEVPVRALKMEICSGAGEWAITQVTTRACTLQSAIYFIFYFYFSVCLFYLCFYMSNIKMLNMSLIIHHSCLLDPTHIAPMPSMKSLKVTHCCVRSSAALTDNHNPFLFPP